MDWPNFTRRLLLADGRITDTETTMIRRAMLANSTVDRDEVAFLLRLKREANSVHPNFDEFLFHVLCSVVLADGVISDTEARWLRGVLMHDGHATEAERQFVTRLKAEAKDVGKEFQRLYDEAMRVQHTDVWG